MIKMDAQCNLSHGTTVWIFAGKCQNAYIKLTESEACLPRNLEPRDGDITAASIANLL